MASVKWSESSCWRVRAFSFKKYKLSDFPLSLFWTSIIRPHPFKQLVIYLNQAVSLSNWVLSVPVRLTQSGPAVTALSHRNVPMLSHGLPLYILSLSSHDLWTDIQDELPNKTCLKHKYSVAKRTFHKVHLSCHFTSGKHNYYVVCLLSEQLNQTLTVYTQIEDWSWSELQAESQSTVIQLLYVCGCHRWTDLHLCWPVLAFLFRWAAHNYQHFSKHSPSREIVGQLLRLCDF